MTALILETIRKQLLTARKAFSGLESINQGLQNRGGGPGTTREKISKEGSWQRNLKWGGGEANMPADKSRSRRKKGSSKRHPRRLAG